ncbi:Cupin domain protein [Collimonas sp. OK307]|uniref:cupin domain-containing protein n=1 Tax=Collimonas sp. OK307 TaxID=1801620 RepID=UPI0008E958A6|nr:cupin domain-containing protein [Collimonas sp. OK307]SFI30156.1 Cupin domain protein [Collimonas sp. OK307]
MMSAIRPVLLLAASLLAAQLGADVYAQDSTTRTELKRADLTGAPGMEVISSIIEIKPGTESPKHLHHGVESGYVLQGTMIQPPGKEPVMLETGTPILNLRDVPHAGFKVVGDKSLKLFTVHVVDKDKPLYDYVK